MAICDPPVKEIAIESDTPLIDELEHWWTPEKYCSYTNGPIRRVKDTYCALEALEAVFPLSILNAFGGAADCRDVLISRTSDHQGRDAVLSLLRTLERDLRRDGLLP